MLKNKISIVTISFNQSKYLEDCMSSIMGQNYENLEYIIVDGGSKDNSREIISDFTILLSSYAPHISEEIWNKLGNTTSVTIGYTG